MIKSVVAWLLVLSIPVGASARTSAAQAPLVMHGRLPPYIDPAKLPDATAILPAPPTRDADLSPAALANDFSCAMGAPLTQSTVPSLFRILERAKADVAATYAGPKEHYGRKRPFVGNDLPICVARDAGLAANGSFPSGHATIGDGLALILAEAAPAHATAILARGRVFGESRVVCGVHWSTDVQAGYLAASTAVAAMQSSADFRADVAALGREIAAAPTGGLDQDVCRAEAYAVAHSVLN